MDRSSSSMVADATRTSRGLEQFLSGLGGAGGLKILDLAGANQENISFLTEHGHQVYSLDLVRAIEDELGRDPVSQTNAYAAQEFLDSHFTFLPDTFDGVLAWDSLQYLSAGLASAVVDRLYDAMTRKAHLLAFFSADERAAEVPSYAYRILDGKTVSIQPRGMRIPGQVYNNRNIERAFAKFESVKMFLTRDSLREVVVRR